MMSRKEHYSDSVVLTQEHLHNAVEVLLGQDAFVFDVETVGEYRNVPVKNQVTWISLATYGFTTVIPMGHPNGNTLIQPARKKKNPVTKKFDVTPAFWSDPPEQLRPSVVFEALRPLMFSDRLKIAHNAPFDLKSVAKYFGEIPPPPYADTIVMAWLINENKAERGRLGLKELTEDIYKRTYDHDNVGRKVEIHPFNKVAKYAYLDSKYDWLHYLNFSDLLVKEGVEDVFVDLEMPVMEVLLNMPGVNVDQDVLVELRADLGKQVEKLKTDIFRAAGRKFNLNSNPQKVQVFYGPKDEGGQGLKPWMLTDGGLKKQRAGKEILLDDYSTKREALEKWPTNRVVKPFLEYQDVDRVLTGYVHSYLGVPDDPKKPGLIFDGKVYPEFVQYGTVTGRFSCVSGNTILPTSRGDFRFDEYVPVEGDLVLTHKGNWKPVLRKIYKGVQPMYRVTLSNEKSLECTQEHRLLTPRGWQYLRDLKPGSVVYTHEHFSSDHEGSRMDSESDRPISKCGEAHSHRDSTSGGNNQSQRCTYPSEQLDGRGIPARESTTVLTLENARPKPDAWEVSGSAPQLSRGDCGLRWVSSKEDWWEVRAIPQDHLERGFGVGLAPGLDRGTPHRWGQAQQLNRQFGIGDRVGSWEVARQENTIREIAFVGAMGVWDVEVADDHSYLTQGFLNHNCRSPNLQNIPRPDTDLGRKVRGIFVAPEGHSIVVADYGQVELVLLAHFVGRGALYQGFFDGVDPHTITASLVFDTPVSDVTKKQRQDAKNINFAVVYGAGADKVARMSKTSITRAKRFLSKHQEEFPEIYRFKDKVIDVCQSRKPPYIKTLLGRKRRLPEIWSKDFLVRARAERQAVNSLIQGSSADLIKTAMIRLYQGLKEADAGHMILTVHDELVTVTPTERVTDCEKIVREAMVGQGIQDLVKVPLSIDLKTVNRWSDAK